MENVLHLSGPRHGAHPLLVLVGLPWRRACLRASRLTFGNTAARRRDIEDVSIFWLLNCQE